MIGKRIAGIDKKTGAIKARTGETGRRIEEIMVRAVIREIGGIAVEKVATGDTIEVAAKFKADLIEANMDEKVIMTEAPRETVVAALRITEVGDRKITEEEVSRVI